MNQPAFAIRVGARWTLLAIALMVFPYWAYAQPTTAPTPGSPNQQAESGTYCGVYCLYAILQMNGQQTNLRAF
jgi:hypothetical protein